MNVKNFFVKAAENWPAKVLSIALALVLFVFHRMGNFQERSFSVPLVMESQTELVPASSYPRTILVTLRGDASSILSVQEDNIQAYVDLSRFAAPGNYQAVIQFRKTGAAVDMSPFEINIEPNEIPLSLDRKISKFVPLMANVRGEVASGFVLNSYALNPTQVIIDGPSRLVGNVSILSTDVIDLAGRTGDFTQTVNILNQDPLLVIRGSGVTEFRGYISSVITVRNFQNVPVRVVGLDERFASELEAENVSLRLEGRSQDALESFRLPGDLLRVDCSAIAEPGTYVLKIEGDVPEGIAIAPDPPEMSVRVFFADTANTNDEINTDNDSGDEEES